VNIDLTADELVQRLRDGKIYRPEKIQTALDHFFCTENILQLRSLALGEVALRVSNKAQNEHISPQDSTPHTVMACISSNAVTPGHIIRRAARIAAQRNATFCTLYVRRPSESADRIELASQRHLIGHFQLTIELGGEVIQTSSSDILKEIMQVCTQRQISTVCIGHPSLRMPHVIMKIGKYNRFLQFLAQKRIDLIILA
jgi:two-component system sensor histidine kinase KdpD